MNGDGLGGQVLCGRYRVEETLKPGGMARVYKVVDTTSNRTDVPPFSVALGFGVRGLI